MQQKLITLAFIVLALFGWVYIKYHQAWQPVKPIITVDPLYSASIQKGQKIDLILVEKEKRQMTVLYKDVPLKRYKIALGFCPVGPKEKQGDGKTPEGTYNIINKNPKSQYYRSLKISYPSKQDKIKASEKGVSPGGEILIHGLAKQYDFLGKMHSLNDWTLGCIGLSNDEMDELYPHINVGTKIVIKP